VEGLSQAASAVLSTETHLVLGDVAIDTLPLGGDAVRLELSDGSLVVIALEPALASALVGRVLGRHVALTAPTTPLDATLTGALAAILIEIARRSGVQEPLVCATRAIAPGSSCVRVSATVLFEGKPHTARSWVMPSEAVRTSAPAVELAALGDLEVPLQLVASLSLASPDDLAALRPGDAWLPGAGWWIDRNATGRAALAAPGGERGIAVALAPSGAVVVGDGVVELGLDLEDSMSSARDDVGGALTDAVLDAPVVVRVEVGAVSLSAREWAALRPGDVIETGRRINDPVVLRVAGREVARGELVEVEGELGVRIREIVTGVGQ
jgi:type III secretion system YscQ/HrcQ family protein